MAKDYKIGNTVTVRLNDGRIVEAKIRAVIERTNGLHRQTATMRDGHKHVECHLETAVILVESSLSSDSPETGIFSDEFRPRINPVHTFPEFF